MGQVLPVTDSSCAKYLIFIVKFVDRNRPIHLPQRYLVAMPALPKLSL